MNKKVKNVTFLSRTVPEQLKKEVFEKQKGTMPSAAVAYQKKLVDGLEKNLSRPVRMFNYMPVYSFPGNYRDLFIKPSFFSHTQGAEDYNIGFFNLVYVKRIFLASTYLRQFKKYFDPQKCDAVICYTPDTVLLKALRWVKKKYPHIKTNVIVPDMPEFIGLSVTKPLIGRIYDRYLAKKTRKMFSCIDSFVFLTEQSSDYFCKGKPYTVVEGISDRPSVQNDFIAQDGCFKTVLYTGTTNERFGILTLLDAFEKIDSADYRLVICGCGDSDETIRQRAKEDSRIIFKGVVPHDEIAEIQRKATVLVNPRDNEGEFTKYSFPSKNMEYLSSGVPLVAYKLDGIPEEYDDHIVYVKDNSAQSLAQALKEVCEWDKSKRREFGKAAQNFVLTEKNETIQTKKILSLINRI